MDVITDTKTLKERIKPLLAEPFVTIDTEFLREKTYYPLLCLIQVGGENDAFAIDPMAEGISLAPLYKLLRSKKTVKVMHACGQDMEIFFHEFGKLPVPVFDTQVAASVLGYGDSIGYGNLVNKICGKDLDKSSRHTDWSARPLTDKQVEYAISDVTYLRDIYLHLCDELESKGRVEWMEEEMEPLVDSKVYKIVPEEAWQKIKIRGGKGEFLAIIKELAAWREKRAQKINKPRNWVLKNDGILEIASHAPTSLEELEGLRYFDCRNERIGYEILKVVKRGKKSKPPVIERKKSLPKGCAPLMDLLRVLLKAQADHHEVSPSIIATTSDLEEIALVPHPERDHSIPCMHGWRYDVFGKFALRLKAGKLALAAENNQIQLIEPTYVEEVVQEEGE